MDVEQLLTYLLENSELVKSLNSNEEPVTLEQVLAHQEDFDRCVAVLNRLPQLATDRLKLSNCLLDSTAPYDSLIGLSVDDLNKLIMLIDYLILPITFGDKIKQVIVGGVDFNNYKHNFFGRPNSDVPISRLFGRHDDHYQITKDIYVDHPCKENTNYYDFHEHLTCYWAHIGDLRGLKWLVETEGHTFDDYTCEYAAGGGYLDCLQYACAHGAKLSSNSICYAAKNEQYECLVWLHKQGCKLTVDAGVYAARNKHSKYLRYMLDNGCPRNKVICNEAARAGNLENLIYAYEAGCELSKSTSYCAVIYDNLDCLKWLQSNNCPMYEDITKITAHYGHVACLKYLVSEGYSYDIKVLEEAAKFGFRDCTIFMHEIMGIPLESSPYMEILWNANLIRAGTTCFDF